jgi:hypothetical protein
MSENYRSHVVEAPNCFGMHLDLGSLQCESCAWYIECQQEVYEKIHQVLNEEEGDEDGNNHEQWTEE